MVAKCGEVFCVRSSCKFAWCNACLQKAKAKIKGGDYLPMEKESSKHCKLRGGQSRGMGNNKIKGDADTSFCEKHTYGDLLNLQLKSDDNYF